VGTKILVYDNQSAYFELLKTSFSASFDFFLIHSDNVKDVDSEYDMVMFFMYDEIELLDFAKLYTDRVSFVLGLSNRNKPMNFVADSNIQYLNLDVFKNELLEVVKMLLEKISLV
jgi:hypothetical protein